MSKFGSKVLQANLIDSDVKIDNFYSAKHHFQTGDYVNEDQILSERVKKTGNKPVQKPQGYLQIGPQPAVIPGQRAAMIQQVRDNAISFINRGRPRSQGPGGGNRRDRHDISANDSNIGGLFGDISGIDYDIQSQDQQQQQQQQHDNMSQQQSYQGDDLVQSLVQEVQSLKSQLSVILQQQSPSSPINVQEFYSLPRQQEESKRSIQQQLSQQQIQQEESKGNIVAEEVKTGDWIPLIGGKGDKGKDDNFDKLVDVPKTPQVFPGDDIIASIPAQADEHMIYRAPGSVRGLGLVYNPVKKTYQIGFQKNPAINKWTFTQGIITPQGAITEAKEFQIAVKDVARYILTSFSDNTQKQAMISSLAKQVAIIGGNPKTQEIYEDIELRLFNTQNQDKLDLSQIPTIASIQAAERQQKHIEQAAIKSESTRKQQEDKIQAKRVAEEQKSTKERDTAVKSTVDQLVLDVIKAIQPKKITKKQQQQIEYEAKRVITQQQVDEQQQQQQSKQTQISDLELYIRLQKKQLTPEQLTEVNNMLPGWYGLYDKSSNIQDLSPHLQDLITQEQWAYVTYMSELAKLTGQFIINKGLQAKLEWQQQEESKQSIDSGTYDIIAGDESNQSIDTVVQDPMTIEQYKKFIQSLPRAVVKTQPVSIPQKPTTKQTPEQIELYNKIQPIQTQLNAIKIDELQKLAIDNKIQALWGYMEEYYDTDKHNEYSRLQPDIRDYIELKGKIAKLQDVYKPDQSIYKVQVDTPEMLQLQKEQQLFGQIQQQQQQWLQQQQQQQTQMIVPKKKPKKTDR